MHHLAELAGRAAAQNALELDEVRTVGRDDIRDLDVRVVDRGTESRQEPRRQHDTHVRGRADLGLEFRVATLQTVILAGG